MKGCGTDAVHQLGEGAGGVPAAPLLMQLRQRWQEVLEGAHAPRPRPGSAAAGPGAGRRHGRVRRGPVSHGAGPSIAVPEEALPLLEDRKVDRVKHMAGCFHKAQPRGFK